MLMARAAWAQSELPAISVVAPREAAVAAPHTVVPDGRRPVVDVAELLREITGAYTQEAGGLSRLPVVRGMADERLRLQIDGMDLYAACPNHMNTPLSYLDSAQVEQIRVWAGLAPVSAGGDALGGVVAAHTPAPTFAAAGQTLVGGQLGVAARSNSNTWNLNAGAQYANDRLSLSYRLSATEADNYHAGGNFKNYDFTGRIGHTLARDEVGSTAYKNYNHVLGVAMRDGAHLWEAKAYIQNMPYQLYPNQRMDLLNNDSTKVNLRYQGRTDWGQWQAALWHDRVDHYMDFGADKRYWYGMGSGGSGSVNGNPCAPLGSNCAAGMPMYTDSATTGAKLQAEWTWDERTKLRAGTEWHRYRLDDYWPPSGAGMWPGTFWNIRDGQRNRHAVYAEYEWPLAPSWMALAGWRYERVRTNAGDVTGYGNTMGNQVADAAAFNSRSRKRSFGTNDIVLSARYIARPTFEAELGFAHRERAPGLYELYPWSTWQMAALMNNLVGDGNGYVGNPDLKKERANTWAASFDWHDPQRNWSLKVAPHVTQAQDYIDATRLPGQTANNRFVLLRYSNVAARLYGLDIDGHVKLVDNAWGQWAMRAQLSHLRGTNRSTGDALCNIMPLHVRLTLTHRLGAWDSAVELIGVQSKTRVSTVRNEIPTPGYGLLNVRTSYRWNKHRLALGVDNLFDRLYYLPTGGAYVGQGTTMTNPPLPNYPQWGTAVPGPGRTFWITFNTEF